jgi:hypothetical protein
MNNFSNNKILFLFLFKLFYYSYRILAISKNFFSNYDRIQEHFVNIKREDINILLFKHKFVQVNQINHHLN